MKVLTALALSAAVLVLALGLRTQRLMETLPPVIASHFGPSGAANGAMSVRAFFAFMWVIIAIVLAYGFFGTKVRRWADFPPSHLATEAVLTLIFLYWLIGQVAGANLTGGGRLPVGGFMAGFLLFVGTILGLRWKTLGRLGPKR